jgi:hypothetical protein
VYCGVDIGYRDIDLIVVSIRGSILSNIVLVFVMPSSRVIKPTAYLMALFTEESTETVAAKGVLARSSG